MLGGHYTGHHANEVHPEIIVAPGLKTHAIIAGMETPFNSHGSLYKVAPLAAGTQALLMGRIPGQPAEPVAWVNLRGPSRVFYTSLGHPGDFENRRVPRDCSGTPCSGHSIGQPAKTKQDGSDKAAPLPPPESHPLLIKARVRGSPRAALASFQVPDDLQLELVLAEPIVRQPVSISLRRTRAALGGSVSAVSRSPPG